MRAPMSWIRDYAELPAEVTGRDLAELLIAAGLEVETVDVVGGDIDGKLVVGRVLSFDEETHANGKTVRWCTVDVGEPAPRGIVCGARNFADGDVVVVALPGVTLPGGFAITARKTYGHVSDGMICSARELGLGDEHEGILVLPSDVPVGSDPAEGLGLGDEVLDIAVTPDRSYCLSLRGVAREAATAHGVSFRDPAVVAEPLSADPAGHAGDIEDAGVASQLALTTVTGLDASASTPQWMQRRLTMCGMRPISVAVDITNYVMLELGQPLHAYDRTVLQGPVVARRAAPGEKLETLDGVHRTLHPDDIVIADDSGPIGLAGTMGGARTELGATSTELVLEAAHFQPSAVARTARRHKLSTEASRRFERGVDPDLVLAASARAAELLGELAGGQVTGLQVTGATRRPPAIALDPARPGRVGGFDIPGDHVVELLEQVGCVVSRAGNQLEVIPPSWRPDLLQPADLDEEVLRLEGYEHIPSLLPRAPAGRGLTTPQRLRRRVGRTLADSGLVEAPCYPFVGPATWDALGLDADDVRRNALRLANPLSDEEPELRTTLLPGLLGALRRNESRGMRDLGLFEIGLVFLPTRAGGPPPRPSVAGRPSDAELAALDGALPRQPWHVAAVLSGNREPAGWWGPGRKALWADAIHAGRTVGSAVGVEVRVRRARHTPWHPGRCAALEVSGLVVGYAGELHPRAIASLGLPDRTSAMELDLSVVVAAAPEIIPAPRVSPYPVATQDVALVVDAEVAAEEVTLALRDGAGELLESLRLFDVYRGEQVDSGRVSLAFSLRFRAPDRTLTADEVSAARQSAVAEASRRTGAVLRGSAD